MRLTSGRQFRSYVISWFLMIVGLVFVLGGYIFYHKARDFMAVQYKQDKVAQVAMAASLIDARSHAALKRPQHSKSSTFALLSQSYSNVAVKSADEVFSLNYVAESKTFTYAVSNQRTTADAILIQGPEFELMLASHATGELTLNRMQPRDLVQANGDSRGSSMSAYQYQLIKQGGVTQLRVNGQPVIEITSTRPLAAKFENQVFDNNHLKPQQLRVELAKPVDLVYRFVPKGQLVYPPGTPYVAESDVKDELRSALANGGRSLVEFDSEHKLGPTLIAVGIGQQGQKSDSILLMRIAPSSLKLVFDGFIQTILLSFSIIGVLIMLAAIFFANKITGPLEQLNRAITRLIHNDFNFKLSNKGFGSFGYLADQFNMMLTRIHKSRSELIQLNKSYSRFVPHQLLKQLSSSGVSDIALGDCCEREMTVLFCDIRGFTTLSESMTPQANFRFINSYLYQIAPVINRRGGIIDKYMGDGIMALFPNSADDALHAAIEMLQALDNYNKKLIQKKLPIVKVGLGLHSGDMMLGTVGTQSRMDATVVSDTVNAASRVESMTKAFSVQVLITEETKRRLKDLADYRMRYIATSSIQGKAKPVTLYEVFNHDPLSLQEEKARNQPGMIKAWKTYRNGDSVAAVQMYQRLIESSPNDKSLFALIERCQSGRL